MKKVMMILASSLICTGVYAAGNTITFQGEVAAQTCSVNVNGTSGSVTVLLPTASTSSLASSGSIAKATPFTINLTGCTAPTASTTYKTVFVANNINSTTGNLANTGTASNVDVQILNPSSSVINFSSTYSGSDLTLAASGTSTSASYTAQYYATGASTAGTVKAALQYAISYQ